MRKPAFCICEKKDSDQLLSNCIADQLLCFPSWVVQSLFYLNLKFQASSHVLWLYSLVCVGPGQNSKDQFSHNKAQTALQDVTCTHSHLA